MCTSRLGWEKWAREGTESCPVLRSPRTAELGTRFHQEHRLARAGMFNWLGGLGADECYRGGTNTAWGTRRGRLLTWGSPLSGAGSAAMAPRTTPRPLATLCLAAFLSFVPQLPTASAASSSSLPRIDFGAIGNVGVVGSFGALSLYDASTPQPTFVADVASLVARSASGDLTNVGATNAGGVVSAVCQSPAGPIYVGGLFTSLGGLAVSNIAEYDPASRTFSPLGAGLDGAVLALSCNSTTVYAGGDFSGPVGATAGTYGGHVAAWSISGSAWSALPFAGLNGPVATIAPAADGKSLFFGGAFTTAFTNGTSQGTPTTTNISLAGNGTLFASLGSSLTPISLNGSDYVASPTTYISGFGRPQYAFCPSGPDGISNTWLLVDGASGSFISRLYRPLSVRGIRLGNTFYHGRGTRNFRLAFLPAIGREAVLIPFTQPHVDPGQHGP